LAEGNVMAMIHEANSSHGSWTTEGKTTFYS